jgi:hypothetical protein
MNALLRIGRLHTICQVAGGRFAPAVRDRASRACRDHVPIALQSAARWLDGDDHSVWIVRRLDLSVVTSIHAAPDEIASSIAGALGRALAKALTEDGDGTTAIRFRNRAAYLSRFVADVADGSAWTRWYFAPLSGWRLLPASAAIRSALVEDPVAGLDSLRALDNCELERVAACLTPADERLVLTVLAGDSTDSEHSGMVPHTAIAGAPPAVAARRPLIRYLQTSTPVAEPDIHGPSSLPDVLTKFGGIALLLRDANALPWGTWTAAWPPPADGVTAETCLKWLTLVLCSGSVRADTLLADEAWRDLLGVPPTFTVRDVAAWLRAVGTGRRRALAMSVPLLSVTRADRRWLDVPRRAGISRAWCGVLGSLARVVYTGFARRLPGFARSSVEYLWRNFLPIDATVDGEQDRVVIRCGRAPLHLVLALTGMTRGLVAGTDVRGRPILVFSRE